MTNTSKINSNRAGLAAARGALLGALALGAIACKDSVVPNFQSPQVNTLSASGIAYRLQGVVSAQREDIANYILAMNSFARDAGIWTTTDSRFVTEWQGAGTPVNNSDFYGTVVWDVEFRNARDAQLILDDLPKVTPAYSAADLATLIGVVQTFKAYNFMLLAETRDTNGVPIAGIVTNPLTPAPILCAKDTWAAIVAILDSGNAELNIAGANPLPVPLAPGFGNVSAVAGPSTAAGSFASFNRALAAKANIELAFAIARSSAGTTPDTGSAGTPNAAALTRADSAARASALFPATPATVFVETTTGDYSDPSGVYHSYSGTSGDIANGVQSNLPTLFAYDSLYTVLATDTTPTSHGRFGKLLQQSATNTPPFPQWNGAVTHTVIVSPTDTVRSYWTTGKYSSPGSPIPIIRGEDLQLFDAVAQLGLGNTANAVTLMNGIHTAAGEPTLNPASFTTYKAVRNQLLEEFRMSTFLESGGDRTIMIRAYGMQPITNNTWASTTGGDTHATVEPIPTGEASARNNVLTTSCP